MIVVVVGGVRVRVSAPNLNLSLVAPAVTAITGIENIESHDDDDRVVVVCCCFRLTRLLLKDNELEEMEQKQFPQFSKGLSSLGKNISVKKMTKESNREGMREITIFVQFLSNRATGMPGPTTMFKY